uniref:Sisters unbound n=1 Tax=Drosophila melanogaster TaxID=7227 RepID=Q9VTM9_DROME|nr:sisters unbound [Drosophila melanogaster]AAF50018.4 sisters unbound [Drosophila melanogaster]|eukprot:NP_729739.3 sisters unbound [Drosophila melanogaster]
MEFVSAISTVGNTETVAREFAIAFLQAVTSDPDNWIVKVSHQFVGQCFRVLGLNFNVSVQAFSQTQDHPYRDANPNYIFDPVPLVMTELDKFLDRLPRLLAQVGELLAKDSQGTRFDELTQPLPCYLNLILKWIKVVQAMCKNMQLSNSTSVDRYICEPLARMSFSILGGLAKLLPKYENFSGFKGICLALTVDVRYGIFYQETCDVVVPPMLDIFRKHYKTFCGPEKSALDFVYCILTVVMSEDDCYIKAYEFLESMIRQFAENSQHSHHLRCFTNELITVKYVVLQFETLKDSNSKPLLLATLKYLMTLQRNVASAECFTKRFHEELLHLVLRMSVSSATVASMAAKVYITLSQRQHQEQEIEQHILETYVKIPQNPRKNITYEQFRNELTRYLKTLIQYFPPLQEFDFYARVLTARNVRIELSLIAAQCASIIFEMHMAEYTSLPVARDQVNELLRVWSRILKASSKQNGTRPLIYSIYDLIDFDSVAECDADLLLNLESSCLENFLNDDTIIESEFQRLYVNISRSVGATGNIQIHTTTSRALRDEQAALQLRLNNTDPESPEMQQLLKEYAFSYMRIHAVLMVNKLHVRYVADIYETLAKFVLEMPTLNENITLYGSESLANMLVLLHGDLKDSDGEMIDKVSGLVKQLQDFCVSELRKEKLNLKRAKFFVCSTLIMHINQLPYLSLDSAAYDKILEVLTSPPRESPPELPSNTYVADMHYMFRLLIKTEEFDLPTNRVWKLLMKYKMSSIKCLDTEIEDLINVFIKYRIESYIHYMSVIQLHIYKDSNVNKKGSIALTAHLRLIDMNCSALDSWLLRYIIFKESLSLLIKNMRIRRSEVTNSSQRNRLLPLKYILNMVVNLRLDEAQFLSIAKLLHVLKDETIGPQENSEIENFITQISTYKYQAEDEHLEATKNEYYEGRLTPLPSGPLNLWQIKTIHNTTDLTD